MPRWSADGSRLYDLQGDSLLMEVEVRLQATPVLSDPRRAVSGSSHGSDPEHGWDPTPDGKGFVTVDLASSPRAGGDLVLIEPWPGPADVSR